MDPGVKAALLELARGILCEEETYFDYKIMLGEDQSHLNLTLKTY